MDDFEDVLLQEKSPIAGSELQLENVDEETDAEIRDEEILA
jgi:hypothetical protein